MLLPQPVSSSVDKIARAALGRDWSLYAVLFNHWAEIVGEDYASMTAPVKISFPKGKKTDEKWAQGHRTDGVLTIKLPRGLMMEFTYKLDQIRQRLTGFFGYSAIERIVLEASYETRAPKKETKTVSEGDRLALAEKLKEIDNPELRAALESLGLAMLAEKEEENG
jgi:hypothetical protein